MTQAETDVRWSGRHAVVTMPAELDMANCAETYAVLSAVISQDADLITADLTGTTFCDSAGIHQIVRAHRRARGRGAELRLAVGESPVNRVLELTGLGQIMPVYHDVQESLATSRTRPDSGRDA